MDSTSFIWYIGSMKTEKVHDDLASRVAQTPDRRIPGFVRKGKALVWSGGEGAVLT
jgi:hypothetical protein